MDLAMSGSDLEIVAGKLRLVSGVEATKQRLRFKFGTWLGEWYLDQRVGIPFVRDLLVKNPNPRTVTTIFREIVTADPGVLSLTSLSVTLEAATRTMTVDIKAVGNDEEPFDLTFTDYILKSER